jgi:SAM-dependent methyltransferase
MPRDALDFTRRAQLTEKMDAPCSRETLRACLKDIARVNRWMGAYRPTLTWLEQVVRSLPKRNGPLRILDVGSGYGDALRRVERWAYKRGLAVELTGLDLNPDATAIAADATPQDSRIQWVSGDVLDYAPAEPVDMVISSLFTHHLADEQIVQFLSWMETHARVGWFVNDLSRAPIPYHLFRLFARLIRLHPFVQYDGPVSIRRAFVEEDWRRMLGSARVSGTEIRTYKPARLCVARSKAAWSQPQ